MRIAWHGWVDPGIPAFARTSKSGGNPRPYPHPLRFSDNALGFRDGRRRPRHCCPGASGACPRCIGDAMHLRQGWQLGPMALNARPEYLTVLETGARASGKSPRAGCRTTPRYKHYRLPASPASRMSSHNSSAYARGAIRAATLFPHPKLDLGPMAQRVPWVLTFVRMRGKKRRPLPRHPRIYSGDLSAAVRSPGQAR